MTQYPPEESIEQQQQLDVAAASTPAAEPEPPIAPRASVTVLADTLQKVLDILATAPAGRLHIEPSSVNAMLLGLPEHKGYDHERAAWTVVSWAHEGGLHTTSAPRLLEKALIKQAELRDRLTPSRAYPARPTTRPAGGRQRAGDPEADRIDPASIDARSASAREGADEWIDPGWEDPAA